jgi:hypothetical protein
LSWTTDFDSPCGELSGLCSAGVLGAVDARTVAVVRDGQTLDPTALRQYCICMQQIVEDNWTFTVSGLEAYPPRTCNLPFRWPSFQGSFGVAEGARRGAMPERLSNAAVAIPSLLIACAFALCADSDARAEDAPAPCQDEAGLALLSSPIAPWSGAPLRVVFTVEQPADGELALIAPDGKVAAKSDQRPAARPISGSPRRASGAQRQKMTEYRALVHRAPPPAARLSPGPLS